MFGDKYLAVIAFKHIVFNNLFSDYSVQFISAKCLIAAYGINHKLFKRKKNRNYFTFSFFKFPNNSAVINRNGTA